MSESLSTVEVDDDLPEARAGWNESLIIDSPQNVVRWNPVDDDSPVARAGENESLIIDSPPAVVNSRPADLALRKAMDGDPTFKRGGGARRTQSAAIKSWKEFLERTDLAREQQVFGWWRIGSIYAYNFDRKRGETADLEQAKLAVERVRTIIPGLISTETLNSATIFGSMPGEPLVRAQRLSKAFNWMANLSEKDISDSISRVHRTGYVIDGRHIPGGGKPNKTLEEREQFIRLLLAHHIDTLTTRITGQIKYSNDPAAIAVLLKAIEGRTEPALMKKWRKMHGEIEGVAVTAPTAD